MDQEEPEIVPWEYRAIKRWRISYCIGWLNIALVVFNVWVLYTNPNAFTPFLILLNLSAAFYTWRTSTTAIRELTTSLATQRLLGQIK